MRTHKNLIPIIAASIIVGFFIWATLPKEDVQTKIKQTLEEEKHVADVVFESATLSEIYDGVKYWELIADRSSINKTLGIARLFTVDGLFYNNNKPTLKFIAPSATWNMKKNEIVLQDPLGYDIRSEKIIKDNLARFKGTIESTSVFHLSERHSPDSPFDGYWFKAKNLDWKLSTKKLICQGNISLTKGEIVISAGKLEGDVGLEKVILTDNPSAKILSVNGDIIVTASKFMVDSMTDNMTAYSPIKIIKGKSEISAFSAVYDQRNNAITLEGDVNITEGDIKAFSSKADYNINKQTVSLTDKAKAIRAGNEIYGDKMTIILGSNKIIVEGRTKAKVNQVEIK
jgi:lipopolysaccharide export system protein LptA